MSRPTFSIVLPVYNEESGLDELYRRLAFVLQEIDAEAEIIFVDDGSRDRSMAVLDQLHAADPRVKVLSFSRNFGHQIAITAGTDYATGDAVIIMDSDLQDPPELIPEMIYRWRKGYDVVYAQRTSRRGETLAKRWLACAFYRIQNRLTGMDMPVDTGDFRLVDQRVLIEFGSMRETHRYVRGLFAWLGFRQCAVLYDRDPRFAGKPEYTFGKSLKLALDAMLGFSNAPLRLALTLGVGVSFFAVAIAGWAITAKLLGHGVPGWASTVVLVSFFSGVQLLVLGILGEYLGRIYETVKARPLYVMAEERGFDRRSHASQRVTLGDRHE